MSEYNHENRCPECDGTGGTTTRDVRMRERKEIIDIHRVQGMECQHLEQSCVSLEALSELLFFL